MTAPDPMDLDAVRAALIEEADEGRVDIMAADVFIDHDGALIQALIAAAASKIAALRARVAELEADAARHKPFAMFGANLLLQYHREGERGDIDGGEAQRVAVASGVIVPMLRTTPCEASCPCSEFHGYGEDVTCYPISDDTRSIAMELDRHLFDAAQDGATVKRSLIVAAQDGAA